MRTNIVSVFINICPTVFRCQEKQNFSNKMQRIVFTLALLMYHPSSLCFPLPSHLLPPFIRSLFTHHFSDIVFRNNCSPQLAPDGRLHPATFHEASTLATILPRLLLAPLFAGKDSVYYVWCRTSKVSRESATRTSSARQTYALDTALPPLVCTIEGGFILLMVSTE